MGAPKMDSEPRIVSTNSLKKRAYITFYFKGELYKEYTANKIGLKIFPNKAKSLKERNRLIELLRKEFLNALTLGTFLSSAKELSRELPSLEVLNASLKQKVNEKLSDDYLRDLRLVHDAFIEFLTEDEKLRPLKEIPVSRINLFLSQYTTSGTYYMNKRRNLGVLISTAGLMLDNQILTMKQTRKLKVTSTLHVPYEAGQVVPILDYLKVRHFNLYMGSLITYSCWLRPHKEVRLLKVLHFKKNFTEIHLDGDENKGKKVRIVYIPEYILEDLKVLIEGLPRDANIFSGTKEPYNKSYFNTAWGRQKKRMKEIGLIYEKQDIYSFRHTAAIQIYRKTKDVYLLQRLLGHSSITVTLKYLRGLGEIDIKELKDSAPTLELWD